MLSRSRMFAKNLSQYLLKIFQQWPKQHLYNFGVGVSALLLIFQFSQAITHIEKLSENRGVLIAQDSDGGSAIGVAMQSEWWKSNHRYAYGPLYFRLAHTLARFIHIRDSDQSQETREKNHHFALMFISLFSFFGLALILAWQLTEDILMRLLTTVTLVSLFSIDFTWVYYALRAHCDLLLCLLVMLATHYYVKLKSTPFDRKLFYACAGLWGLAFSTKLSIAYLIPTLFLFPGLQFIRKNALWVTNFFVVMLLSYFLVGLPQNFAVHKVLSFLGYMSSFTQTADTTTLFKWMQQSYQQFLWPVLGISFFALLFGQPKSNPHARYHFFISLIPFLFIYSRKYSNNHEHYLFPFFCVSLILYLHWLLHLKSKYSFQLFKWQYASLWAIPLIWFNHNLTQKMPNQYIKTVQHRLHCREEVRNLYKKVDSQLKNGGRALLDPFIPYPTKHAERVNRTWFPKLSDIQPDVKIIGLTQRSHFLERKAPSDYEKNYTQHYGHNWLEIQQFYKSFLLQDIFKDHLGRFWKKILDDPKCGRKLWIVKD